MAKKKEPVAWITMNGVHIPLYEGESKEDAVKRSISKAKENVKANEDQKEKDIARNKAEKDRLNRVRLKGISDTINVINKDKLNYTYDKDKNEYIISKKDYDKIYNDAVNKKYIENLQVGKGGNIIQTHGYHNAVSGKASGKAVDGVKGSSGNKDWSKQDIQKLADSRKISYDEAKKLVERYNTPDNAGDKAVDRFKNAESKDKLNNDELLKKYKEVSWKDSANIRHAEAAKLKKEIDDRGLKVDHYKDKNGTWKDRLVDKNADTSKDKPGKVDFTKPDEIVKLSKELGTTDVNKLADEISHRNHMLLTSNHKVLLRRALENNKDNFKNASAGKASDEARVKKVNDSFREQAKSIVAKEKESWKNRETTSQALSNIRYLSKHELKDIPDSKLKEMYPYHKNQVGVEIAEELLNRGYQKVGSGWQIKVPKSFAANYPNLSSSQLKAKYEEYLKKNRK